MGAASDWADLAVSDATAKTLSERTVFIDPHVGHLALEPSPVALMVR
jgi:hypothetical protein